MLTNTDLEVLNEVYRNSKMAVDSIETLLSKIYDDEMALDLNHQAAYYRKIKDKTVMRLLEEGYQPDQKRTVNRAKVWAAIQANTILNSSTEHIADMLIQGNTKGITDLLKKVHANRNASPYSLELAEELMDFEQDNITKLKSYL